MSEQLTIEILREKFKESQEKGEELIVLDDLNHERSVLYVGDVAAFVKYKHKSKDEYSVHWSHLYNWKIKQPKDEYEVLYANMASIHKNKVDSSYTVEFINRSLGIIPVRIMRNKRTGEIAEYNEELLK